MPGKPLMLVLAFGVLILFLPTEKTSRAKRIPWLSAIEYLFRQSVDRTLSIYDIRSVVSVPTSIFS
jgi:hypothetical protein